MSSDDDDDDDLALHFIASLIFGIALSKWVRPMFLKGPRPVFFAGLFVRVVWAGIVSCIISPYTMAMMRVVTSCIFLVLMPFLLEIHVDEIRESKHLDDPEPQIVEMDDEISWEYVARLKSSNNGYNSEQFYPVTLVNFSEMDDPLWPHASLVYLAEIRRRSRIWRTITIWQVSVLNGGRKKMHTFHDFFRWTDANWFGRRFEIPDNRIHSFHTSGVVLVVISYCGECNVYIHDIRHGKSAVVTVRVGDVWCPLSICCLGRLVEDDGEVHGWRIRWMSGYWDVRVDGSDCVRITQKVLDVHERARYRSHDELVFGSFEDKPALFPARNSRSQFGVAAVDDDTGITTVMMHDPVTGRYGRCMSEDELRLSDHPYDAVRRSGQFSPRPMVLSDRECITCFSDGTVLRAQFAAPTLKYRTAKAIFRINPGLRDRMNAEQFRQMSGIDGMAGHFR